ncbi:MAG: hypothetical protein IKY95_06960 [Bacteroidales bacterium]|nr:hypothetical protein [Bacteroidales bacterium]
MSFLESTTAVCVVLIIIAVLLLVLVLMAAAACRGSSSGVSSILTEMKAMNESLVSYGESLETLCRHMCNTDRNIATLKNYLKEDKAMSCYAVYMAQIIDLRRSWETLSVYAGLLSKVRHLSELDKDDTMIRMMSTHLAETEDLCSRINGDRDMYPLQRRRLVNYMKVAMEGYVFPLLESIHYHGSEELSKTIERIREEIF